MVLCCIGRNWDGMRVLLLLLLELRGDATNNVVGVMVGVFDVLCGGCCRVCRGVVFVV